MGRTIRFVLGSRPGAHDHFLTTPRLTPICAKSPQRRDVYKIMHPRRDGNKT